MRKKERLQQVIKELNEKYPDFLKAIEKKETDKEKHKNVLKHPVWNLLEELKICMTK